MRNPISSPVPKNAVILIQGLCRLRHLHFLKAVRSMRERMLDITAVYFRCFDTPIQHAACGGGRTRPRAGGKGGKLIPCIALVGWVARQCIINDHSVSGSRPIYIEISIYEREPEGCLGQPRRCPLLSVGRSAVVHVRVYRVTGCLNTFQSAKLRDARSYPDV